MKDFSIVDADMLLKKLICEDRKKTRPNLKSTDNFYNHCNGVGNNSYMLSCTLRYKGFDTEPELVGAAGLLHDIGKIVATPDEHDRDPELVLDSIYGSNHMAKLGYYEIADIIRPSFTTKELLELKPDKFPELNPEDFIPKDLKQKTVVYFDTRVAGNGNCVSFKDRMADIRNRYNKDSLLVKSLDIGGEARLRDLNREIEKKAGLII